MAWSIDRLSAKRVHWKHIETLINLQKGKETKTRNVALRFFTAPKGFDIEKSAAQTGKQFWTVSKTPEPDWKND